MGAKVHEPESPQTKGKGGNYMPSNQGVSASIPTPICPLSDRLNQAIDRVDSIESIFLKLQNKLFGIDNKEDNEVMAGDIESKVIYLNHKLDSIKDIVLMINERL
jgi:hypothetical protein